MQYLLEVRCPEVKATTVTWAELPGVYANLKQAEYPAVVWNDCGDDVLIVAVGDDYSVTSMLTEATWYWLVVSHEDEEVFVYLTETGEHVPRKAMAPRDVGLAILQRANDFPGLRSDYMWDPQ
jgi:hypothetical protein